MPAESNTSLLVLLPELILLVGLSGLFVLTLTSGRERLALAISGIVTGLAALALLATLGSGGEFFGGAYRVDGFSRMVQLVVVLAYGGCLVVNRTLHGIRPEVRAEYFFLLAASVFGLMILAGSVDLIVLVVALELSSFPLFLLIAMRREEHGQRVQMEAAIKYMMFGVGASGLMLFGMSYLYGLGGTTSIPLLAANLAAMPSHPLLLIGLLMSVAAFFYKLAVFPFHFWTPDVYEGASHETATVIAALPKIVVLALLVRFLSMIDGLDSGIVLLAAVMAAASMFFGNLLALLQTDFKRLLGFSAIAHGGYTLVGVATLGAAGYAAALYYMTGYVFSVLACFLVINRVAADGSNPSIRELAGLHHRSPLLAATLLAGVFSLAGIPPFVGFMGKFSILFAAWESGLGWLVLLALINTVIAAYYYLGIIRETFFGGESAGDQEPLDPGPGTRITCLLLMAIILLLGIAPQPVIAGFREVVTLLVN